MYQYTDFDTTFVQTRADQYRNQLERWQAGKLSDEEFRPLRLQNGWYLQRHAPMLRVAVPYGEVSSAQIRALADMADRFDKGYLHFTTRQNVQFNWIPIEQSADAMDALAAVNMHGIQTSGNCIRNITTDALAGFAADEVVDPRPWCEIIRQWSTLHPEFAFLPRKFKVAVSGALEDRAATHWHDVGLHIYKNTAGELGFRVLAGGGMGRTPVIAPTLAEFVPAAHILNYLQAVLRVYNRFGRRDNMYKARIKILVKAEGQKFIDEVNAEYQQVLQEDGARFTVPDAEVARMAASFAAPKVLKPALPFAEIPAAQQKAYAQWLKQNVKPHADPELRAVTLSFKRKGIAPGDATSGELRACAELADAYSSGEARVTHEQNLLLPWVHAANLPALYLAAKQLGVAGSNIGLLTDIIACPGGDFCDLANARSIPIALAVTERYQDADELHDLGEIDLHISGCINSCGHHHSGHIGVLGVDKDGKEWYQITLGGSDGTTLSGAPTPGKVVGPSFTPEEVPDVIDAVLEHYRAQRQSGEAFIHTLHRVGFDGFKAAANSVRVSAQTAATTH